MQAKILSAVRSNRAVAPSGAYVPSCWVHEENVDYCSNQGSPNCVGWSPAEPGSKKWGYTTSILSDTLQQQLTPQQAFGMYYDSRKSSRLPGKCADKKTCWAVMDGKPFPTNPSCAYRPQQRPMTSHFSRPCPAEIVVRNRNAAGGCQ